MMRLKRDEQEMLDGKEGLAKQKAMELLVKYAEGLGADRFVDTNNVTIIVGSIPDIKIVEKVVPSLDADEIASRFLFDRDDVDIVVLGCPHATLDRMRAIAGMLEGKRIHKNTRLYVTTCHLIKNLADKH